MWGSPEALPGRLLVLFLFLFLVVCRLVLGGHGVSVVPVVCCRVEQGRAGALECGCPFFVMVCWTDGKCGLVRVPPVLRGTVNFRAGTLQVQETATS